MPKTIVIHQQDSVHAAARQCVQFGFCTAVCPTYMLDGEEWDSPRGRIALAQEMFASNKPPSATAIRHLDRCLSCLSCESTCGAGVPYHLIIDGAREYIERSKVRPLVQRWIRATLARILTTPALLRPTFQVGRRLLRGSTKRLPGSLREISALAAAPALAAFAPRPASCHIAEHAPPPHSRVALLAGCVQSVLGTEINAAAARLLARSGVHVESVAGVQCCGALELHMGRRLAATKKMIQTVRRWSSALETEQIEAIVSTTSGCMSVMKRYEELLSDHPDLAPHVRRCVDATLDISQVVQKIRLNDCGAAHGLHVSYHDACSLKHGLKLTQEPRRLLRDLGMHVHDIAESHLCCGSAGTYNILQPALAQRLGKRKAGHASATQADVIAAGNLGCLVQISRYTTIPVAHTVQLLDWASGGPAPRGLEAFEPSSTAMDELLASPQAAPSGGNGDVLPTAGDGDFLW